MKSLYVFFLFAFLGYAAATPAVAQKKNDDKKNKEEIKKWKKKKNELDPLAYRDLVNSKAELVGENEGMKRQLVNMGKIIADKDAEIESLRQEIATLQQAIANKGGSSNVSRDENEVEGSYSEYTKGVWFRVQVGVYSKIDASMFKDNNKNFSVEQDADGAYKYTLGHFRDYWEADNFKKYLRKMGVKDAWIVAYKDNQRMNIKDVLEAKDIEKIQNANKQ
ncbi:MAG: Ezrin/radixin/moesin family protein [Cytophagales bacterium]|nr:Ezrin/radixin/moesin family protein [Bernardetiaceae bacterium]MDW8204835.1 Ezrin/radixin/moesin family protein [Cytophagales bacterium]